MYLASASAVMLVLTATVAGQTTNGPPTAPADLPFPLRPIVISNTFPRGYQAATADLNNDGRPDVVALGEDPGSVEWFENPGRPEAPWPRHPITGKQTRRNIDLAVYDVDGDKHLDVVVASDFDLGRSNEGGTVTWFRRPGGAGILPASGQGTSTRPASARGAGVSPASNKAQEGWQPIQIYAEPTVHRIRWVDVDGDGRKELITVPILGKGARAPGYQQAPAWVRCHWIPADPVHEPWPSMVIDASLTLVHGVSVVDWDGNGREAILTASSQGIHLFKAEGKGRELRWSRQQLTGGHVGEPPNWGSSEVCVGRTHAGRFLAAIEPWHGNEVVVYTRPRGAKEEPWLRQVIDSSLRAGHALCCVDLDGGNNDEIVAGYRGEGTSLYGYRLKAGKAGETPVPHDEKAGRMPAPPGGWERFTIDAGGIAAQGCVAADINGDGRPDLVTTGGTTHNLKLYINQRSNAP